MLTADHKKVKGLFGEFKKWTGKHAADDQNAALVKQVCDALWSAVPARMIQIREG
jgi:hypothetical protein